MVWRAALPLAAHLNRPEENGQHQQQQQQQQPVFVPGALPATEAASHAEQRLPATPPPKRREGSMQSPPPKRRELMLNPLDEQVDLVSSADEPEELQDPALRDQLHAAAGLTPLGALSAAASAAVPGRI